jgi:hypothetical protein
VLVDVPWPKHLCFMDSKQAQEDARRIVREAVESTKETSGRLRVQCRKRNRSRDCPVERRGAC